MMHKATIVTVLALALAATTTSARADVRSDLEEHLHGNMRRVNSGLAEELAEFGKCRAMLATAKKKLKPTDKLRSQNFGTHPKAVKDGDTFAITVADVPWICDEIDRTIARGTLWAALESARGYQKMLAGMPALDARARIDAGAFDLQRSKECVARVAAEEAGGAKAIEWKGSSMPIAEARGLCDVLQQWGEYQNRSGEANFETVAPKYRELGVGGDRLRLFVQYDNVSFRGQRCAIIEDLPVLAKRKYVYQWLENADGTHTIRKYTFTGDRYKSVDKTFLFEKQAYAYCK